MALRSIVNVPIMNLSLSKLGSKSLNDEETSVELEAMEVVYQFALEEILSEHPWTFAQKRAALEAVVPDDVSRTIEVDEFDPIDITGATAAEPVVITAANHGLKKDDRILITGVAGMTNLNGNYYYVANETRTTFELVDQDGEDIDGSAFSAYTSGGQIQRASYDTPITISNITQADPAVVTTLVNHGLATNDWIKIIGVKGMTDVNETFFQITKINATSFSLKATDADDAGDGTDSSAFGAYTYGGVVLPAPEMVVLDETTDVVVYRKPSDWIKPIKKSVQGARISIEGNRVIADVLNLKVIYTRLETNTDKYFPKFTNAFAMRLAAELCFKLTNSVSKTKEMMSLYRDDALPSAVAVDSTQGSPDEINQDEWIDSMELGSFPHTTGETWHPA